MKINEIPKEHDSWFGRQHGLLLKAVLLGESEAIPAFNSWNDSIDWEGEFDQDTYTVLPLLYASLERYGVDHAAMGRLRGLYRRSWYQTQRRLASLPNVFAELDRIGCPTLLLGEAAVMAGYPEVPGSRTFTELEILVSEGSISEAVQTLRARGVETTLSSVSHPLSKQTAGFAENAPLRVTIRSWPEHLNLRRDQEIWERGRRAQLGALDVKIPGSADLFMQLVEGGAEPKKAPSLLRAVSLGIVIGSPTMDWNEITEVAQRRFCSLRAYEALSFFRNPIGFRVPNSVLSCLGERRVSFPERAQIRAAARSPHGPDPFWGPMERLWLAFLRHSGPVSVRGIVKELPGFVRGYYGTDSLLRISRGIIVNGVRRVARILHRFPGKQP